LDRHRLLAPQRAVVVEDRHPFLDRLRGLTRPRRPLRRRTPVSPASPARRASSRGRPSRRQTRRRFLALAPPWLLPGHHGAGFSPVGSSWSETIFCSRLPTKL